MGAICPVEDASSSKRSRADSFSLWMRELRHNQYLMAPLTLLMLLLVGIIWLVIVVIKFPTILLGILIQPIANRLNWVVEFLYPTCMGKWVHFSIMRFVQRTLKGKSNDKSYGYHTRTIESRFEVIPGRVFIHPLPQLIDNLGYLVICLPTHEEGGGRIVAFVVDCGDAETVVRQVKLISSLHYNSRDIRIQAILSTHKHHDHTAGNRGLKRHPKYGQHIKLVFGGAVERVPECNFPLANGDKLPLPRDGLNDMRALMEIEAVAIPGHTRGSLAYVLRPNNIDTALASSVLFTGDTMFSGGAGVPFEADTDTKNQDENDSKSNGDSFVKASAAMHAVERCLAEILFRSVTPANMLNTSAKEVIVFPGHEYTYELLNRQFLQHTSSCRWSRFAPSTFFDTISHFYVAMHRRNTPASTGRILVAATSVERELMINPNLRSLKKRGDIVINSLRFWNRHCSSRTVADTVHGGYGINASFFSDEGNRDNLRKSKSTDVRWNLDANDINATVFTTVFTADLNRVIQDLDNENLDPRRAAHRLKQLKSLLDVPVVGRRPIPGTLPSDRNIYRSLVGFALLGSSPTALTISDSTIMKLSHPIGCSSDEIIVSKRRLVSVLYWLGLLTEENEGRKTVAIISHLWKDAWEYQMSADVSDGKRGVIRYDAVDLENSETQDHDKVSLGSLKWILYGIPSQQPSLFPSWCMPCAKPDSPVPAKHPMHDSGMIKEQGELVRHDVFTCLLCRSATGCPEAVELEEVDVQTGKTRYIMGQALDDLDTDQSLAYVEVTPDVLGNILR